MTHRMKRRMARWLLLFLLTGSGLLHAETSNSDVRPALRGLTSAEQARLAERFAPVLVFHSAEQYFPTSPLFQLKPDSNQSWKALLGTPDSRNEIYRSLTLPEKSKLATVFYRAYPAWNSSEPVIILEYWLYYAQNDYRVRGNILPFWFDGSHPNDLEHIHLVLRADSAERLIAGSSKPLETIDFAVEEVFASAHEGKIPANGYQYADGLHQGPTRFLVELGSHAMAPDIDEDGLFTPIADGDSGAKVLWGIRDSGMTWSRYQTSYMTPRSGGNAIVFSFDGHQEPLEDVRADQHFTYRLASVDSLSRRFDQLQMTDEQRKRAFENQVFWFNRAFGKDNGRSDTLLLPSRAEIGGESVGILGVSSSERLFLVGTVLNVDEPGFFAGGRYSFLTSSRFVPDLTLQMDGVLTRNNYYLSPQFLFSYPLDGFTRVMVGQSLVSDSVTFDRVQWGWMGAIEIRLGDMRISAVTRKAGPGRPSAKEFRLFYGF